MNHSAAEIVQQLLIDLGVATDPDDGEDWPAYYSNMPDSPDDCLAVLDTSAIKHGRSQVDGTTWVHYGVQVTVRGGDVRTAYVKARDVSRAFDEDVVRDEVTLDDSIYTVHAVSRTGAEVPLGPEGTTRRRLWTLNALASITLTGTAGTAT